MIKEKALEKKGTKMYWDSIDKDSALEHLVEFCEIGTNEYRKEYMESSFTSLDLEVSTQEVSVYGRIAGTNIYGKYVGDSSSDEYLIIGAHHDKVYNSPGANDNGSGSIALIELAKTYIENNTEINVLFASYALEEQGLHGSRTHAKTISDEEREKVVGMFNLDCIGNGPDLTISLGDYNGKTDDWMNSVIEYTAEINDINVVKQSGFSGTSDHAAFVETGFRAAYISRRDGLTIPNIHDPSDTVENVNLDQWVEAMDLAVCSAYNFYRRRDETD